jgi:hypothetical protein
MSLTIDYFPAWQYGIPLAVLLQLDIYSQVLFSNFLMVIVRLHPWECIVLAFICYSELYSNQMTPKSILKNCQQMARSAIACSSP